MHRLTLVLVAAVLLPVSGVTAQPNDAPSRSEPIANRGPASAVAHPVVEAECASECWFPTDAPQLTTRHPRFQGFDLLSREAYDRVAAENRERRRFVALRELPDESRPLLGFAEGLHVGGSMYGLAFYGSPKEPLVYLDLNGDGSLRDETARPLLPEDDHLATVIETDVVDHSEREARSFPLRLKILLQPTRGAADAPRWWACRQTTRDGMVVLNGRRTRFRLWGQSGLYNHSDIWFDLDGDGRGFENEYSSERFRATDPAVNLEGWSYSFRIDRYGTGLGLTRCSERRPDRPRLELGVAAPPVSAVDLAGRTVDLESLRGKIVLLYFWTPWCGPCRGEAPALVELESRYRERGFVIVGISPEAAEDIERGARELGEEWPQVADPGDGPLHRAYRVNAYPTSFLLGRDGVVLAFNPDPEEIAPLLARTASP